MSTRLVILGLLKDRPLHGYELKHIIEHHMGDWTNIAFGSIYFALKKLKEEELVEELGVEQQGNRPSRRMYGVTAVGRNEFYRLLEELFASVERDYYPLDIGLFFLSELPPEKRLPLIERRIAAMEEVLKHLEGHETETRRNPRVPPVAAAIFSHTRHHARAELSWLNEVKEGIQSGMFP